MLERIQQKNKKGTHINIKICKIEGGHKIKSSTYILKIYDWKAVIENIIHML